LGQKRYPTGDICGIGNESCLRAKGDRFAPILLKKSPEGLGPIARYGGAAKRFPNH